MPHGHDRLHHDEVAMLLARCAQADEAAFRSLWDLEASRLLGIALRIVRDHATAKDTLHDAMVQVWRNAGRFCPSRGTGQAWLTALLRYRALDAAARIRRDAAPFDPAELLDDAPDPHEHLVAAMEADTLTGCLDALDPRRRNLIQLAYLNGMTHADLAARSGEPLGTIKSTIRRALLALRACMGGVP